MRSRAALAAVVAGLSLLLPSRSHAQENEQDEVFDIDIDADTGYALIVDRHFWHMSLLGTLKLWRIQTAFEAPINLDLQSWEVRPEDWDEGRDYMRIFPCTRFDWARDRNGEDVFIREGGDCASWGLRPPASLISARLGPVQDLSLGQGHVMTGFSNYLDVDHYTLGVVGEFSALQWFGGDLVLADITRPDVMGGRIYLRPLFQEEYNSEHRLEIGLTAVGDVGAPTRTATAFGGARLVDHERNLVFETEQVAVFGADLEYKFNVGRTSFREHFLAIRGNYAFIYDPGRDIEDQIGNQGGHFSFGYLWEPADVRVTLEIYGEYRMLGSSYLPSYFDDYYTVQREQYALSPSQRRNIDPTLTKLGYLRYLGEDEATFEHSYAAVLHVDFWYDCWDPSRCNPPAWTRLFRIYAFVDHIIGRHNSGSLGLVVLAPDLHIRDRRLILMGAYIRRGFNDIEDAFSLDGTLLRFGGRINIWRGLYFLATYDHMWRLDQDTGYFEQGSDFLATFGWSQDFL